MEGQSNSQVTSGTCQKQGKSDIENARLEIVEYARSIIIILQLYLVL